MKEKGGMESECSFQAAEGRTEDPGLEEVAPARKGTECVLVTSVPVSLQMT